MKSIEPPPARVVRWAIPIVVVAAGSAVRLVGITHGAPSMIFHPDVAKQAIVARAVYGGETNPTVYFKGDTSHRLYPYGASVLLGRILGAAHHAGIYEAPRGATETADRWLWGFRLRGFSAVVFLGSVVVVVAALVRDLGAWPALAAGLLLVLEPWNVQYSHYGMNDVPLSAMLLLAWLAAGRAARGSNAALGAAISGAALGLGFGIKYQALLGLFFPAVAGWQLWRDGRRRALVASTAVLAASWLSGVLFASPLVPERLSYFYEEFPSFMQWQANITGRNLPFHDKAARNVLWLAGFLASGGTWALLPGAAWAAMRLLRGGGTAERRVWMLSALAVAVILTALLVVSRDFMRANDLLPVLPFLILLSVMWLAEPLTPARSWPRRATLGSAAVVLIGVFAASSLADARAFSRPDTRERARQWCRDNLKPKSRVLRERYVLPVDRPDVGEVAYRAFSSKKTRSTLEQEAFDVVITSSLAHDRFFDPLSPYYDPEVQSSYRILSARYRVLAVFRDRTLDFAHPVITVYSRRGRLAR